MGAQRTKYQIVGRYMNGKEVTAYHIQSLETGKSGKYTREQVCYLVGRDQITNCTGQLYQDKVLLRGVGCSLDDLPVQYENGDTKNTDKMGKVRRNETVQTSMEKVMITRCKRQGRSIVGYVITNSGGASVMVSREKVIELAEKGLVGNARVQNYNNQKILRGVGCDLNQLPSFDESAERQG